MKQLLLLGLLISPSMLQAAPWCLIVDGIENCSYSNADNCYSASTTRGGSCMPNSRELGIKGDAPYCLVSATERSCIFASLRECRGAADRRGDFVGCVENTEKALEYSNRRDSFEDLLLE